MARFPLIIGILVGFFATGVASGGNNTETLHKMVEDGLREWASQSTIVDAVRAQNQQHKNLSADDIMGLDHRWRAEKTAASKPMRQALMANVLSSFLNLKKRSGDGLYTEIFVMDNKGMLVGLSDITSDYLQGDEDKWQKTFMMGPGAVHIAEVVKDKSTHKFQSQVSLPVIDPVTRKAIGAVTLGIDLAKLRR